MIGKRWCRYEIMTCIAISHMWSDRLGNAAETSMPACQLLRMQKLIDTLVAEQMPTRPRPVGFWIDTIYVPVNPDLKKAALRTMHDIYRNATAFLAVVKSLLSMSHEIGWLATLWQMYMSNWYKRLWTLL
jgi:hypothetical protein